MSEEEIRQREATLSRLRLVWDNRRFLLRVFVWSLLASGLIVLLIPNRYEAVERLMPPDTQSGMGAAMLTAMMGRPGSTGLGAGAMAGDLLGLKSSGALFVGILGGRTVQDQLIEQFDLRKVYRESKMEDARKALADHTRVSEDRKSGIISIEVTDHDARRAAEIAKAYVNELDRLVAQVSTSSARRERLFLEGRLKTVKEELSTDAHRFSEFASKNTAIDIPAQGKAMVEAAAVLQGQLIAAESELSGLEAIYTDENVRVRTLRARVGELRSQLGKLGGKGDQSPPASAQTDPTAIYPTIRQLPVLGVTYFDLYRQTKIQETVYELLTQQYELAKVQEAKEIPSVKVLDAAVVATKKSFPPRILLTALGALLGLTCAMLWLFTKRRWVAIDPQDPGKQFALEVFETLREDSRRLAPATALSRMISRRKTNADEEPEPKEGTAGSQLLTGKSFTRAAGGETD
jgi:capsule polysaccharide export protein KpsE/RkpR